jgi:hypothetical protein
VKRIVALSCALLLALSARAGESAPPQPASRGYAFDQPEVMAAQLLWGVAHGARLLALACAAHGREAMAEAWVDWHERERERIHAAGRLLGRHYFDDETVSPGVISATLGLKSALALPQDTLGPACDTLREALAQPRYDLERFQEKTLEALQAGAGRDPAVPVEVLK